MKEQRTPRPSRVAYIATIDQSDITGRNKRGFWFSGAVRRLTDEQAAPLLAMGKITKVASQSSRRTAAICQAQRRVKPSDKA